MTHRQRQDAAPLAAIAAASRPEVKHRRGDAAPGAPEDNERRCHGRHRSERMR